VAVILLRLVITETIINASKHQIKYR